MTSCGRAARNVPPGWISGSTIPTRWRGTTSVSSLLYSDPCLTLGYWCLGDLRWEPSRELMILHYVSFKWAGKIRAVLRRSEDGAPVVTHQGV